MNTVTRVAGVCRSRRSDRHRDRRRQHSSGDCGQNPLRLGLLTSPGVTSVHLTVDGLGHGAGRITGGTGT